MHNWMHRQTFPPSPLQINAIGSHTLRPKRKGEVHDDVGHAPKSNQAPKTHTRHRPISPATQKKIPKKESSPGIKRTCLKVRGTYLFLPRATDSPFPIKNKRGLLPSTGNQKNRKPPGKAICHFCSFSTVVYGKRREGGVIFLIAFCT